MRSPPRRSSRPVALLVALVALDGPGGAHAADIDQLRFRRPIALAARSGEELVSVPLDGHVYGATAEGYADLRVLDDGDRDVSRVVRAATLSGSRRVRDTARVGALAARPQADGSLEVDFTVAGDPPPRPIHGLRILTPLVDFEQSVEVLRGGPDGTFRPAGGPQLLYDYSRFADSRSVEIALPESDRGNPAGTWRLRFADPTVEQRASLTALVRTLDEGRELGRQETSVVDRSPFRIDGIETWHEREVAEPRAPRDAEVALRGWEAVEEGKEGESRVTRVRVRSDRTPVSGFRIDAVERNFSRPVRVEIPGDDGPTVAGRAGRPAARLVAEGRIARVDLRGITREQTLVAVPESRARAYELVIAHGDSPALSVTAVSAIGPAREVVFVARPGADYRLAYGAVDGAAVEAPRFDTAAIDTALAAGEVPQAGALGEPSEREVAPRPLGPRVLGSPWLLGGVILVLAAWLAVSLYRAARRLDAAVGRGDRES